jgi:hypothetical protein
MHVKLRSLLKKIIGCPLGLLILYPSHINRFILDGGLVRPSGISTFIDAKIPDVFGEFFVVSSGNTRFLFDAKQPER